MIDSARIGYGISLLGEAILREGFFDATRRCAMSRKPKQPCRMTGCPNLTDRKSCYCETHEKTMQPVIWQGIRSAKSAKSVGDMSLRHSCITSSLSPTAAHMMSAI